MSALTIQKYTYVHLQEPPTYHIVVKNRNQLPEKGEWTHEVDIGPFSSEKAAQNFLNREAKALKVGQKRQGWQE